MPRLLKPDQRVGRRVAGCLDPRQIRVLNIVENYGRAEIHGLQGEPHVAKRNILGVADVKAVGGQRPEHVHLGIFTFFFRDVSAVGILPCSAADETDVDVAEANVLRNGRGVPVMLMQCLSSQRAADVVEGNVAEPAFLPIAVVAEPPYVFPAACFQPASRIEIGPATLSITKLEKTMFWMTAPKLSWILMPFNRVSRITQFEALTFSMSSIASHPREWRGVRTENAVGDDNIAAGMPGFAGLQGNAVVAAADIAIGDKNIATAVDIEAVAARLHPAIDPQTLDPHLPALDKPRRKHGRILQQDPFDPHVCASPAGESGAGGTLPGLGKRSSLAVDRALSGNGDVIAVLGEDQRRRAGL